MSVCVASWSKRFLLLFLRRYTRVDKFALAVCVFACVRGAGGREQGEGEIALTLAGVGEGLSFTYTLKKLAF